VAIKNFENQLIFGEDIDKSKVARFLWPTVYLINQSHINRMYSNWKNKTNRS